MPRQQTSLLDIKNISFSDLQDLFMLSSQLLKSGQPLSDHKLSANNFLAQNQARTDSNSVAPSTVALLFFEASTRTRFSFEMAAWRAGFYPTVFEAGAKTSLEKGETIEDTILNIAAMQPRALIIRSGDGLDMSAVTRWTGLPVINAGWGVQGHPTQALLDAFTLQSRWGADLSGKKLLFVGDVRFSRVVSSHLELAEKLGYELAQCGPQEFLRQDSRLKTFTQLSDGLKWADAVMSLRFQFERHDGKPDSGNFKQQVVELYSLSKQSLRDLSAQAWIMHPGPINQGLEMQSEVLSDPRCLVLDQVRHGVYLRQALFAWLSIGAG